MDQHGNAVSGEMDVELEHIQFVHITLHAVFQRHHGVFRRNTAAGTVAGKHGHAQRGNEGIGSVIGGNGSGLSVPGHHPEQHRS